MTVDAQQILVEVSLELLEVQGKRGLVAGGIESLGNCDTGFK